MIVVRTMHAALAALGLAAALALPVTAGEQAPKPRMAVSQITQDAAGADFGNSLMIGLSVIMAVTLVNAGGGGAPD